MNHIAYFFKDAADELRRDLPPEATIWAPIYDPTDDTEMERILMIASTMDAAFSQLNLFLLHNQVLNL